MIRSFERNVAVPSLLAYPPFTNIWFRGGRTSTGLVVETGLAREFITSLVLAGYGAEAIHPYLALETILHNSDLVASQVGEDVL